MPGKGCKKCIPRVYCVYDQAARGEDVYNSKAIRCIVMDWVNNLHQLWNKKWNDTGDDEYLLTIVDEAGKKCLNGVVEHGDLKHDNVLFVTGENHPEPRFIDFGMAELSDGKENWHNDIANLRGTIAEQRRRR